MQSIASDRYDGEKTSVYPFSERLKAVSRIWVVKSNSFAKGGLAMEVESGGGLSK
jgi:hypothetical protein